MSSESYRILSCEFAFSLQYNFLQWRLTVAINAKNTFRIADLDKYHQRSTRLIRFFSPTAHVALIPSTVRFFGAFKVSYELNVIPRISGRVGGRGGQWILLLPFTNLSSDAFL